MCGITSSVSLKFFGVIVLCCWCSERLDIRFLKQKGWPTEIASLFNEVGRFKRNARIFEGNTINGSLKPIFITVNINHLIPRQWLIRNNTFFEGYSYPLINYWYYHIPFFLKKKFLYLTLMFSVGTPFLFCGFLVETNPMVCFGLTRFHLKFTFHWLVSSFCIDSHSNRQPVCFASLHFFLSSHFNG